MSEITHKAIEDIRAELAAQVERTNDWRARAVAAELEAGEQRTRAETAEQELRDYTAHVAQSRNEDRSKLAAAREVLS